MAFWILIFLIVSILGLFLFKSEDEENCKIGVVIIIILLIVMPLYFRHEGASSVPLGIPVHPTKIDVGILKVLGQASVSDEKAVIIVESGEDVICLWSDGLIDPNSSYVTIVTKEEEVESVSTKSVTRILPADPK